MKNSFRKNDRFFWMLMFLFISFSSCYSQNKIDKTQPLLSKDQAIIIFKNIVHIDPINCLVTNLDGQECIICLANKTGIERTFDPTGKEVSDKMTYMKADILYYQLTKFANVWRIKNQKSIYAKQFYVSTFFNDFKVVKIENKPYLYFLYELDEMGNAMRNSDLNFSLFSLTEFQLISLNYGGEPYYDDKVKMGKIKGRFYNLEKLNNKPEILRFLETEANNSSVIYRATGQDVDLNNPSNYEKKWHLDNSEIKSVWEVKENTKDAPLKITYYDKNIFPVEKDYIDGIIENTRFKIVSINGSNILGYNKVKMKYFPIWVETCNVGCKKEIAFINDRTLSIKYFDSENLNVIVDLGNMTYRVVKSSSVNEISIFLNQNNKGIEKDAQEEAQNKIEASSHSPSTNISGLYKSSFPNISIELQSNGNVFVSPKQGKRIYCSTKGSWKKSVANQIIIELDVQQGCEWISDLAGIWELSNCKTFEGNNTYCLEKGNYKFINN